MPENTFCFTACFVSFKDKQRTKLFPYFQNSISAWHFFNYQISKLPLLLRRLWQIQEMSVT